MSRKNLQFITLGDAAVGKTSIINQYTGKGFDDEHIATLGIDFGQKKHTIKSDGSEVSIKIWDTAGQERFRTLTTNFYRRADGIIVSFDVTDKKTFDAVSTWMKAIADHADASADVVLCGNKIDLVDQRQVSEAQGKSVAENYKIKYFETSAKQNEGLTEMMEYIIEKTYQRKFGGGASGDGTTASAQSNS